MNDSDASQPSSIDWPLTTNEEFLGLLYQALGSPLGILVRVSDLEAFRRRAYSVRRDSLDERLKALTFRASPIEGGNLCILHAGRATTPFSRPTPCGPNSEPPDV